MHEQARVKDVLATRDRRRGIDPATRHEDWLRALPADELARRQLERTTKYQLLPKPLQQAHARAWQHHRDQHHIPRGDTAATTRLEHHHALPHTADERDNAWLRDTHRDVLFDLHETSTA